MIFGTNHLEKIEKGFVKRAAELIPGFNKNKDAVLPEPIKKLIQPGTLATADPKIAKEYAEATYQTTKLLTEAFTNGLKQYANELVDLAKKAIGGDEEAIGALGFEILMFFVPGDEEIRGGKATSKGLSSIKAFEAKTLEGTSAGIAVVKDAEGINVGAGWVSNGELMLSIKTTGTTLKGRGSDVFRALFEYANAKFEKISSISGVWRESELSSNLNQFNAYLKQGLSESDAALKTFTSVNAKNLGFKNARIEATSVKNADGTYQSVDVTFTK